MFKKPIRHVPLKTLEELFAHSYQFGTASTDSHKLYSLGRLNDGSTAIIYCDEFNRLFITPYRPDILDFLVSQEYRKVYSEFYSMPFTDDIPVEYKWLQKIAEEEIWAFTHEKALKCAHEKGIKPIVIAEQITLRQIVTKPLENHFENTNETYYPMVDQSLSVDTFRNIGTYIHLNSKSLLVCDEYGRTFYIAVNGVINDIENQLIDAGYTRTLYPDRYVKVKTPAFNESIPNCYPF